MVWHCPSPIKTGMVLEQQIHLGKEKETQS